jgi:hypothetical protein
MKIKFLRFSPLAIVALASTLLLGSCTKDDEYDNHKGEIESTAGVYVLCEGNYGRGNSTITYYNNATGTVDNNYYKTVNGTNLGETANDLKRYGSKMYCVVSGLQGTTQSFVDVMDAKTGKSIKRISFNTNNDGYIPRKIAFYQNKAYVTRYDGKVSRIDTASLNVDGEVMLSEALEGLAVSNGKLYVANSDYSYLYKNGKNTVVSVVDLASFTKIKDITVSWNPTKVAAAPNGDIYVACDGDYANLKPALDRINTTIDTKVSSNADYAGYGSLVTGSSNAYVTTTSSVVRPLDFTTGTPGGNFITDGTSAALIYGLTINDFNKDLYVFDAISYSSSTGKVYSYGADGKRKSEFTTGQLPKAAVFVYNYK